MLWQASISLKARWAAVVLATLATSLIRYAPAEGLQRSGAALARTQQLKLTAHLHYVAARGSYLIEEGPASGALAGTIKARVRITAEIAGSFTFYSRGGSVSGYGSAKLHESGAYASFGGSLKVLGGTGRYTHARGGGKLYGVYNRRSPRLELTIQTTGTLAY
jgi:hypothetical protein